MVGLNPQEMGAVANRLRRAQGQIGGVLAMIEQGRECQDIVTQLAADNHALDRAGSASKPTSLQACLAEPDGANSPAAKSLEKLFLSLAWAGSPGLRRQQRQH